MTTQGLSWFNAPIFHPAPLTLAYSEHLLADAILAAPVLLAGGDAVLAHNLVFLACLALSGLGAYLLAWELTGSRGAAWIGGIGFAFAPFRFGHLGHLQLQAAQFMPVVLLYLHRWARDPRWSFVLLMGLFWLLQILSCGYYALFISLAVGLFLLWFGALGGWWRQGAALGAIGGGGPGRGALGAAPVLALRAGQEGSGFCTQSGQRRQLRGPALELPGRAAGQPALWRAHRPLARLGGRAVPGPGALGPGAVGRGGPPPGAAVGGRRPRPAPRPAWREQGYYLLLAWLAIWASLGPHWGLYALLYKVLPGFNTLRVPASLAVLVTLAWAMLAAWGWQQLLAWRQWSQAARRLLLLGLSGLVLLESCSVPIPWLQIYDFTPEVYQWLARQTPGSVVFEAPTMGYGDDQARDARYLYWSTKHGQVLVNGYSGFFPPDYQALTQAALRLPDPSALLPELYKRGTRFLVVHLKEYEPESRHGVLKALRRAASLREVFTSEWDYAFLLLPPAPPAPGS